MADLEIPPLSAVRDALATIAAGGRHTRVGLTPRSGSPLWTHDPHAQIPVHRLPDAIANASSTEVLQFIRCRPGIRHPLEVHVSHRHIALDADHGLGDGRFTLDLLSGLFAIRDGRTPAWVAHRDTPLALPRALARTFGTHPGRIRTAWRYGAGMRGAGGRQAATVVGDSSAWVPSFAVAVAHVSANAESEVNEWRRSNATRAGSAPIWLYILRNALRAAGLQIAERIMIAFDCRRYLARGMTSNGNFMIGLRIPFVDDDQLPAVIARMRECTTSALPLAGLGAVSALAFRPTGQRRKIVSNLLSGSPVDLTYTDMGHIGSLDDLPWRGPDERSYTGLLDPVGPHSVTVLNSRIGSGRSISISFHDNVFDRSIIDKAAESLMDPIQFLPPSAM